jgi:hypothetical protein
VIPVVTKGRINKELKVADEAWCGLALLHREHPEKPSFTAREILDRIKAEHATPELRAGLQPHIYLHNVANVQPNSARYRMFYKLPDETYRLFRQGDPCHPSRRGKITPVREEFPDQYHYLLDWYHQEYCAMNMKPNLEDDPILNMRGLGKEIWAGTNADEYVRDLRANWHGDNRDKE